MSGEERRMGMKINYRSTDKRADSGTNVLVLACAPLQLFRETADLCNTSQIGPKYLVSGLRITRSYHTTENDTPGRYLFLTLLNLQRD
jgi:hypothetical protein